MVAEIAPDAPRPMDEPVTLPLPDFAERLAWALRHHVWMLPPATRKGRIRLDFGQCPAIAKRVVAELEQRGLVEVKVRPPLPSRRTPG